MTKEEYRKKTKIKNEAEAKFLLKRIRIGFIAVFLYWLFLRSLSNSELVINGQDFIIMSGINILLLIGLVVYCFYVLGLLNQPRWFAIVVPLLPPIGFIFGYYLIAQPLGVILGTKAPPKETKRIKDKPVDNNLRKNLIIVILISSAIMVVITLYVFITEFGIGNRGVKIDEAMDRCKLYPVDERIPTCEGEARYYRDNLTGKVIKESCINPEIVTKEECIDALLR